MRIAYLDCFAGVAGDMFLGALLQAGVPAEVMREATAALKIGAQLRIETVDRSGISAVKVHVLEGDQLAESGHAHEADHRAPLEQRPADGAVYSKAPETQHQHKAGHTHEHSHEEQAHSHGGEAHEHGHEHSPEHSHEQGHEHDHEHSHAHGRSLTAIREIIRKAVLPEPVKVLSIRAFELLGRSEAKIHNVPVDSIHFHEVGAVDAIVDIVAASAGICHLQIGRWYCSEINTGSGMVQCAHGNFPVPAPATADLLRGMPTYAAHLQKELTTPTGAALVRALDPVFGPQPRMRVEAIGYGAGTRNPEGFPNVLRLSVGELHKTQQEVSPLGGLERDETEKKAHAPHAADTVTVLETALDDLSPQVIAYAAEKILAAGALDVMLTPVMMKKGRPGTLLTVLCTPDQSEAMQQMLLRETSTLGVRLREERRVCLERAHVPVETAYGAVRMKVGSLDGEERNAAPEFEDCRAVAEKHGVALKLVQQAATAAYRNAAHGAQPKAS